MEVSDYSHDAATPSDTVSGTQRVGGQVGPTAGLGVYGEEISL
jgi:hypothetical protein